MVQAQTNSASSGEKLVLFATSRPSRVSQVTCTDEEYDARCDRELAWAEQIGMDVTKVQAFGGITGSPSGTKKIHELDDFYDDFPL